MSGAEELPLPPAPTGRDDYEAIIETGAACVVVGIESTDPRIKAFAFAQAAAWYSLQSSIDDEYVEAETDDDADRDSGP